MIFDCETNGLPDWKSPSDALHQPHPVQFAALLIDPNTIGEVQAINHIVKPDGWTIPDEVAAIHGITTERAMDEGVPESFITGLYLGLSSRSTLRVGHNINFDLRIMRIALMRSGLSREDIEAREALPKFCTMNEASKIMKMAPTDKMMAAGITWSKNPKLSEAYKHFFNEEMTGAHDAIVDVRATSRLYFHLMDLQKPKTDPKQSSAASIF